MKDSRSSGIPPDVLNVMGEFAWLDDATLELLERGRDERVQILEGTERPGEHRTPYARTSVEIEFDNEDDLRECVKLLRWSDDRLRARPEIAVLWEWTLTFREGMKIFFGVNWYDRDFYERRKDAFKEGNHVRFYEMFGADVDRLQMKHEVLET